MKGANAVALLMCVCAVQSQKMCMMYVTYFDTDMASHIIEMVQPYVGELVVVDGPRMVNVDILKSLGMLYAEGRSPVRKFFAHFVATRLRVPWQYRYKVWTSEREQRNVGFNLCTFDVMLQLEGDGIIKLYAPMLSAFLADKTSVVAWVSTHNMVNSKLMFTASLTKNQAERFPLLVKRNLIAAEDYINHIWLVGVNQSVATHKQFPISVGYKYHLSLLRSELCMLVKYSFYRALAGGQAETQKWQDLTTLYGTTITRVLFLRSMCESATCFPSQGMYIIPVPFHDTSVATFLDVVQLDHLCYYSFLPAELMVISAVPSWSRLNRSTIAIAMRTTVNITCSCTLITVYPDTLVGTHNLTYMAVNGEMRSLPDHAGSITRLLKLECHQPGDGLIRLSVSSISVTKQS